VKARIYFPSEGEAAIRVVSSRTDEAVECIEVEPEFWSSKAAPNLCFIETLSADGKVLQKLMVRVRGTDGRLQVIDRSKPAVPACDAWDESNEDDEDEGEDEDEEEDESPTVARIPPGRSSKR
jgi:lipopolysaccharide export LptBFGC system permease protein LptF